MVRVHIWVRKKEGTTAEDFREYWTTKHAPLTRDGYEHLRSYAVDFVTRVPEGQEQPYDGVAVLEWEDRDGFKADMGSEAAKVSTEDLQGFSSAFGLLFVEQLTVK
jgi:uncharacterized protein (TIGR02118 family)